MARRSSKFSKVPLACVEGAGLAICVFLALISFGLILDGNIPCKRGALFACHSVVKGKYSSIGPVPLTLLGVLYFGMQLGFTRSMKRKGALRNLKFLAIVGGIGFIAFLRAVELLWLKAICLWCWGIAAAVLIQGILMYKAMMPPLPKLASVERSIAVLTLFLVMIAASIAAGLAWEDTLRAGSMEIAEAAVEREQIQPAEGASRKAASVSKPKPAKTEKSIVQKPKIVNVASDQKPIDASLPAPRTAVADPAPHTPEGRTLHSYGWKVVGSTDAIYSTIRSNPPVLLLAYDPNCGECHTLIYKNLTSPELSTLPVTKVAIEQSLLDGKISQMVQNLPTLLLLDRNGVPRLKQEGRISAREIVQKVNAAL